MAALNFPPNPTDGQLYPDPPVPGQQQYVYSARKHTWQTVAVGVAEVFGEAPVVITGKRSTPIVTVNQASNTQAGYITPQDYALIHSLPPTVGTVTEVTAGVGLSVSASVDSPQLGGGSITTTGVINLLPSTLNTIGGVMPGAGLTVDDSGRLNVITLIKSYLIINDISDQFDGVKMTFDIFEDGEPIVPGRSADVWIFLGGVFQTPGKAFFAVPNAARIIFSEPPEEGTSFYGVVFV